MSGKHLTQAAVVITLICGSLLSPKAQSTNREQEIAAPSVQEGLKYFTDKKYSEAAKSFQKATESEPENSFAYYAMALSLANLKQYGSALESLRYCYKLNPHPHWRNITEEMVRSFLKETERNTKLSKKNGEQPLKNDEEPVVKQSDQSTAKIDDSVFANAVRCFHKLRNAVGLGVSLIEYRRLLLDAKTDFDDAVTSLPRSAQRSDLEAALTDYIIAGKVWQAGVESRYGIIPIKSSLIYSVDRRYDLGLTKLKQPSVPYDPLLHMIWEFADQRIDHAGSLQR
jgi:tetratricopeptide (TPR) repeat protein